MEPLPSERTRVRPRLTVAPVPATQWAMGIAGVAACGVFSWMALGDRMGSAPPNLAPGPTPSRAAGRSTPAPAGQMGMQKQVSGTTVAVAVREEEGMVKSDSKTVVQAEMKGAPSRQVVVTAVVAPLSAAERTAVAIKEASRPPPGTPAVGMPAVTLPPPQAAGQIVTAVAVAVVVNPQAPPPPLAPPTASPTNLVGDPPPRQQAVAPPTPGTGSAVPPARPPQPAGLVPTATVAATQAAASPTAPR